MFTCSERSSSDSLYSSPPRFYFEGFKTLPYSLCSGTAMLCAFGPYMIGIIKASWLSLFHRGRSVRTRMKRRCGFSTFLIFLESSFLLTNMTFCGLFVTVSLLSTMKSSIYGSLLPVLSFCLYSSTDSLASWYFHPWFHELIAWCLPLPPAVVFFVDPVENLLSVPSLVERYIGS